MSFSKGDLVWLVEDSKRYPYIVQRIIGKDEDGFWYFLKYDLSVNDKLLGLPYRHAEENDLKPRTIGIEHDFW